MTEAAMEKDVSKWLPNAQAMSDGGWDETKPLRDVVVSEIGAPNYANQGLPEENAGAHQYKKFYAWGNEPAPVEGYAPSAKGSPHTCSVRRRIAGVKAGFAIG
jgi:hypothetical protein